ncbi:E3 ubiquitin-protein ligase NHLRC1-like [Scyliorhinus torazame]|uniref:E3 ubiquitin-protein ligase NHLRC1-like n=1 Tax=Scyliorhinus torazame TaxID=75743 RepID=UPI003B59341E
MCSAEGERQPRSLLRDIELNVLECKVCFERFSSSPARRPCALPCGHAVCRHCASALSHRRRAQQAQEEAAAAQLECPFCRRSGPLSQAADCVPLLQLAELLSGAGGEPSPAAGGGGGGFRPELCAVFGGWGRLLNPRGLAVCGRSGAVAVVQDGEQPLGLFERGGRPLPGPDRGQQQLRYPLDVALAGGGRLLLVTDAGDSSLKVFRWGAGGRPELAFTRDGFGLPWGLAGGPAGGTVLLTDWARGSLLRLTLQLPAGGLLQQESVCERLCGPREVALCPLDGCVHVVEHLAACPGRRRLSTFNSRGQLLRRMDSLGLGPGGGLPAGVSAIAVDGRGNVLLADGDSGAVLCVGTVDKAERRTIIDQGLIRPVALACPADDTLIVLDAGDHTWKVYRSRTPEAPDSTASLR